jgi:predicted carbohydrate-binding protein with CBM5 and CBM33 domain
MHISIPSSLVSPVRIGILGLLMALGSPEGVFAHGTMANSRMMQVRLAGPSGNTPATWNETYYTWNQNSNNFTTYDSPTFSYPDYVPDGSISSGGVNDGVQRHLNFTGLNTPSANWAKTNATAGSSFAMTWLASAPHEPSHFSVYLTNTGFDVATEQIGWSDLEFLGSWSMTDPTHIVTLGTGVNPIDGSALTTYNWAINIPTDRSGHVGMVVVWQREDSAGEAFFSTNDLNVTAVPEPSTIGLLALVLIAGAVIARRRIAHPPSQTH